MDGHLKIWQEVGESTTISSVRPIGTETVIHESTHFNAGNMFGRGKRRRSRRMGGEGIMYLLW